MMRSIFAGVSGLRNHQVKMDVIGNNISNVNTVGFKGSRTTFKESFAQMIRGGSRPGAGGSLSGGTNPAQVGLGMSLGTIDTLFTQGNLEDTGVTTDLAMQGDSLFVVSDGTQNFFTRAGNFRLDGNGNLVSGTNGFIVQGKTATNGVLNGAVGDIRLPLGQRSAASATDDVDLAGNLDASAATGTQQQTTMTVFDSLGNEHELRITFTKDAVATDWDYSIQVDGGAPAATGTITFDAAGNLTAGSASTTITQALSNGANNLNITVNFGTGGTTDGLSHFGSPSTAVLRDQNGNTMGELERIAIDASGTISGAFTNGVTMTLAQVAIADFNNPSALIRSGDNMFSASPNSGNPIIGYAGSAGSKSAIVSGALEMSNVDLAQEFTSMITAQRGFQSNARVISTADEMLQELTSLTR